MGAPGDKVVCKFCLCAIDKPVVVPIIVICPCPCHWQAGKQKEKLIEVVVTYYPQEVRREVMKQGGQQA